MVVGFVVVEVDGGSVVEEVLDELVVGRLDEVGSVVVLCSSLGLRTSPGNVVGRSKSSTSTPLVTSRMN